VVFPEYEGKKQKVRARRGRARRATGNKGIREKTRRAENPNREREEWGR
jgi:hypothetical protein